MSKPPRRVIPIKVERPSSLSAADKAAVLEVCARYKAVPGALLEILHGVQAKLRYVPKDAVPLIAYELNLSRAEVHGVDAGQATLLTTHRGPDRSDDVCLRHDDLH